MRRAWLRHTPMRVALGVLTGSVALAVFLLVNAIQLTPVPTGAVPVLPNPGALAAPPPAPAINIPNVVSRDVFDAMRSAPTNRYLLAFEIEEAETPATPPPRVVVLGIALADGGRSFATCQVGAAPPVIVRVGDKLGPYTIKAIERKRVTITLPGGATEILEALNSGFGT